MSDGTGQPLRTLNEAEAYDAMCRFLEAYWERGGRSSDDIAVLLGSLNRLPDGGPVDPAMWVDWQDAVNAIVGKDS
jgi:hypothetical protein